MRGVARTATCVLTGLVSNHSELAGDLHGALERGELYSVFQPQVALSTGAIVATEVLCRWRHPVRGSIPADEFIAVAEDTGAIQAIGRFILDEALQALDDWHAAGQLIGVSVNVSLLQLTEDGFASYLAEQAARRGPSRHALTIEITESRPMREPDVVLPVLGRLRGFGVGVALDDFGTEYSSVARLERLPITELKLDRSLIQQDPVRRPDLAETVRRVHRRGLRVVAEGVETRRQLDYARELGCDRAQGFLFSGAAERGAFEDLRARWALVAPDQTSG